MTDETKGKFDVVGWILVILTIVLIVGQKSRASSCHPANSSGVGSCTGSGTSCNGALGCGVSSTKNKKKKKTCVACKPVKRVLNTAQGCIKTAPNRPIAISKPVTNLPVCHVVSAEPIVRRSGTVRAVRPNQPTAAKTQCGLCKPFACDTFSCTPPPVGKTCCIAEKDICSDVQACFECVDHEGSEEGSCSGVWLVGAGGGGGSSEGGPGDRELDDD